MMQRWKITIEYNGAPFCGWQRQPDKSSVQGAIQDALFKFCQQPIEIQGAGRTDAGVHARAQIAHFDLDYNKVMNGHEIAKAINAHLHPHPISIVHAEIVADDFHARFEAKNKLYVYRIVTRTAQLTIDKGLAWHRHKMLDHEAMHEAAQLLLGVHDFSSFRAGDCQAKSPIRSIDRLDVVCTDYDDFGGKEITVYVEGQAFLHHMVRNIVGSLVLVGKGKWAVSDMSAALAARERKAAGPTAAPHGLYLMRIDYPKV
jgi:tRNA pseudouridine38-40 synthase